MSHEHDVAVHTHLSETEQEVADCVDAHGVRPAYYLDRLGLLHERSVLAHGVWLDDDELALVAGARRHDRHESGVEHEARSRARVPVPAGARGAGIAVGLGTDGAASNNSLDLLGDVKVLALLQKHASGDPSILPVPDAWSIATGALAPALGGTPLAVGQPADFLLVDASGTEMTCGPLLESLVYATSSAAVDTVVVDGRVLMRHRQDRGRGRGPGPGARGLAARLHPAGRLRA